MPRTPSRLLDLAPGIGQRAESVVYNLTDDDGNVLGAIHPVHGSPRVTFDGGANIGRTLSGVTLTAEEFAQINPYADRVAPLWKLEDGTTWPLGRFYFTGAPQSGRLVQCTTLYDVGLVLDTASTRAFGVSAGGRVRDAMVQILNILGIRDFFVADTDVTSPTPIAWNVGTSWLTMLRSLTDLAGFIPPHTTNYATVTMRNVDAIELGNGNLTYGSGQQGVVADTLTLNPNLLDAPNAHLVTDSGATGQPVSAIAYVNPSLPWSVGNRGFVIAKVHAIQGIESTAQGQAMADQFASTDPSAFEEVGFTSAPDPRHDAYEIVGYKSTPEADPIAYREVFWSLEGQAGGAHQHRLVRSGVTGRDA